MTLAPGGISCFLLRYGWQGRAVGLTWWGLLLGTGVVEVLAE